MTPDNYGEKLYFISTFISIGIAVVLLDVVTVYIYCHFLKQRITQEVGKLVGKLVLYQKLGVLIQDYLRAREYTERGRMGDAGKIYEGILHKQMVEVLEELENENSNLRKP